MRRVLLAASVLCTPALAQAQDHAADSARAAAVAVVQEFHRALAAGDSTAALATLHPDAVIYEGGHAETLPEYRAGHLRSDIAFAAAMRREITAEAVEVRGDVALYMAESHTSGQWRDREVDRHGTETVVLVRTPEGWRIRHIHWSSRR